MAGLTYDTNEFGDVLEYVDGRKTFNNRSMTDYERQLLDELATKDASLADALAAKDAEIDRLRERLKAADELARRTAAYFDPVGCIPRAEIHEALAAYRATAAPETQEGER